MSRRESRALLLMAFAVVVVVGIGVARWIGL
jgi:hypothetical protein